MLPCSATKHYTGWISPATRPHAVSTCTGDSVGAHEVHPSEEKDWTLVPGNWSEELKLRHIRNCIVREMLKSGRSAQFRSSGNSLYPMVRSGDVTMWEPVTDHHLLVVGEVVVCAVQEGDRFYAHMIHEIKYWADGSLYWMIGNMTTPPIINGWCAAKHIYGRLMEVSPVQPADDVVAKHE